MSTNDKVNESLAIHEVKLEQLTPIEKISLIIFLLGLALFFVQGITGFGNPSLILGVSFCAMGLGGLIYIFKHFLKFYPGIRNNNITKASVSSRGTMGFIIAIALTSFYCFYYWASDWNVRHFVAMFDTVSHFLRSKGADRWFVYGTIYTFSICVMGVRMLVKYRDNRYQQLRTCSVMFAQTILAFFLPALMAAANQPEKYLNYFWPLSYNDMMPANVDMLLTTKGAFTKFLFLWTAFLSFLGVPIFTYFWGKRWYCSWVCGCGGLANTFGDNWRQLSNKSLKAWKIERVSIHSILIFVIFTTILMWVGFKSENLTINAISQNVLKAYIFLIAYTFAGVVGTGFYPIFGTRVWCRFGCPQAAILGIIQRFFSRFRITTNGGQCISCGNCSTYCEMGIDVRSYAQKGQNIIRASCVGCGICSAVCPRGVLSLENGPRENRINEMFSIHKKNT